MSKIDSNGKAMSNEESIYAGINPEITEAVKLAGSLIDVVSRVQGSCSHKNVYEAFDEPRNCGGFTFSHRICRECLLYEHAPHQYIEFGKDFDGKYSLCNKEGRTVSSVPLGHISTMLFLIGG